MAKNRGKKKGSSCGFPSQKKMQNKSSYPKKVTKHSSILRLGGGCCWAVCREPFQCIFPGAAFPPLDDAARNGFFDFDELDKAYAALSPDAAETDGGEARCGGLNI